MRVKIVLSFFIPIQKQFKRIRRPCSNLTLDSFNTCLLEFLCYRFCLTSVGIGLNSGTRDNFATLARTISNVLVYAKTKKLRNSVSFVTVMKRLNSSGY